MKYAVLVLGVIFLTCNSKVKNINSPQCNEEFDVFLEKFKSDSIYQRQHINFPVEFWYSDEDFPLDMMMNYIDEENYTFIDLNEYVLTVKDTVTKFKVSINQKNDTVFYHQSRIEKYVNLSHKFLCVEGEWKLVQVVDNTD